MRIRKEAEIKRDDVELLASISDALAHPVRIEILKFIMTANRNRENVSNKSLTEAFGYAQSTISQHMKKLTDSGLVEKKSVEKYTYYYLNLGLLIKYVDIVKKFPLEK